MSDQFPRPVRQDYKVALEMIGEGDFSVELFTDQGDVISRGEGETAVAAINEAVARGITASDISPPLTASVTFTPAITLTLGGTIANPQLLGIDIEWSDCLADPPPPIAVERIATKLVDEKVSTVVDASVAKLFSDETRVEDC